MMKPFLERHARRMACATMAALSTTSSIPVLASSCETAYEAGMAVGFSEYRYATSAKVNSFGAGQAALARCAISANVSVNEPSDGQKSEWVAGLTASQNFGKFTAAASLSRERAIFAEVQTRTLGSISASILPNDELTFETRYDLGIADSFSNWRTTALYNLMKTDETTVGTFASFLRTEMPGNHRGDMTIAGLIVERNLSSRLAIRMEIGVLSRNTTYDGNEGAEAAGKLGIYLRNGFFSPRTLEDLRPFGDNKTEHENATAAPTGPGTPFNR